MLLALGHRSQNGKDTLADYLIRHKGFVRRSWADPLREEVTRFFGWTPANYNVLAKDIIKPSSPIFQLDLFEPPQPFLYSPHGLTVLSEDETPAFFAPFGNYSLLQYWGTDVRRRMIPTYWIDRFRDWYQDHKQEHVVIPDTRFVNEGKAIHSLGGYVIKVYRIQPDGSFFINPNRDPNHPSEVELQEFQEDYRIDVPEGKLDVGFRRIDQILQEIS